MALGCALHACSFNEMISFVSPRCLPERSCALPRAATGLSCADRGIVPAEAERLPAGHSEFRSSAGRPTASRLTPDRSRIGRGRQEFVRLPVNLLSNLANGASHVFALTGDRRIQDGKSGLQRRRSPAGQTITGAGRSLGRVPLTYGYSVASGIASAGDRRLPLATAMDVPEPMHRTHRPAWQNIRKASAQRCGRRVPMPAATTSANGRPPRMPVRGGLEGMRGAGEQRLGKMRADQLHAQRHPV